MLVSPGLPSRMRDYIAVNYSIVVVVFHSGQVAAFIGPARSQGLFKSRFKVPVTAELVRRFLNDGFNG